MQPPLAIPCIPTYRTRSKIRADHREIPIFGSLKRTPMPVSKNRRKSKKAQRRKVNRARAESSPGWGGVPDSFDYPALPSPSDPISGLRPMGIGTGETPGTG